MDAGLGDAAPGLGAETMGNSPRLEPAAGGDENASLEGAAKPAATPSALQFLTYRLYKDAKRQHDLETSNCSRPQKSPQVFLFVAEPR